MSPSLIPVMFLHSWVMGLRVYNIIIRAHQKMMFYINSGPLGQVNNKSHHSSSVIKYTAFLETTVHIKLDTG